MNKQEIVMTKNSRTIVGTAMLFVVGLVAIAFLSPTLVVATEFSFGPEQDFLYNPNPVVTTSTYITEPGVTVTGTESSFTSSFTECAIEASRNLVTIGDSIDLSWYTSGFSAITVNGQTVSQNTGTMTIQNLQNSTTFTLQALSDNGARCFEQVTVLCAPPVVPPACALLVEKTVNSTATTVGAELTYTITVTNTGDANCSGGGVKIEDVIDANLLYLRHTLTSNLTAGYGSTPVYTSSDRTLHFNGNTLTPGESGTITWTGKVQLPTQCGDFTVKNQAKATAYELNNFQTWVYSPQVTTTINNDCVIPHPPVCTLVPDTQTVGHGGSAVLTWTTENATAVTLTDFGAVALDGTKTTAALYTNKTYTLLATGPDGQVTCTAIVLVTPEPPAPTCTLLPDTQTIQTGRSATFTWATTNADTVTLTSLGDVAKNGTATTAPLTTGGIYELVATGNGKTVSCSAAVIVETVPLPTCDSFVASPTTIMVGTSTTLAWQTSNATSAYINNGVGVVAVDGSVIVTPLASLTYQLTLVGENNQTTNCFAPVTVTADPVPVCEVFTASPSSLSAGGGSVTLNWKISNAKTVTIAPSIGAVALVGSQVTNITQSTTFTLTALDDNGDEVRCTAPVIVADPVAPFTCANNVLFSASPSSFLRGNTSTLTWSTTGVETVSISGINATTLSGSQTVSPASNTTYELTATSQGKTIYCPVSVNVTTSGGGGGGSVSPRCELTISDKRIKAGEKVTLTWDTTNATGVTLSDDRGEVLFTTDEYLASDKRKYYDYALTLKPTRTTEYTLLAERSSRDEECSVKVVVEDDVVVLQTRDQGLVAGISLTQVPYTGFEAGPFMTAMFYLLLIAWSLYITYLLVVRKQMVTSIADNHIVMTPNEVVMQQAESVRPDLFVKTAVATPIQSELTPANLPIGPVVVGYENQITHKSMVTHNPHQVGEAVVTDLENRAHTQKALLSSDAVRHFISTTDGSVDRHASLDEVIGEAKKTYPLEDGWIVINESRMRNLCTICKENQVASSDRPFIPATVPEGTGSLAEAIVTGNIVAAYKMIGNRPMFALADAAADLDALYRNRRGGTATVSDMLTTETKQLSDEQLKNTISALTGALDGTYTSEEEAVKVAIMKAVKAVA
ncbi:DUF11 domain-containing protein [Candidatus Kaiserbacteria bacterium]|nr:DUF11 domain-containing protein [Candidatus Kaiserbacteria bacterium]